MSSLSFLFSLPLFFDYEFDYNFFWTKATLHLASTPFPDEAAALFLSSLSPSSTSAHPAVSPLSHTLLLMCSNACQVRCSSCKPTPVALHIFTFLAWYSLLQVLTSPFINIYHKLFISRPLHIVSRHTCIILHMHITRYKRNLRFGGNLDFRVADFWRVEPPLWRIRFCGNANF